MIEGEFRFIYPWVLSLLILIPLLAVWFLFQQRKYWQDAFAFSQISLLKMLENSRHPVLRQRILPIILLLVLVSGIIGLAQPVWKTKVMTKNSYIMLVMDISISMEATDMKPNRMEVAKKAAIEFVNDLPDNVKLGLAFFAGNSYLITPPVENHMLIAAYLESLKSEDLRQGTAIGEALITASDSLEAAINQAAPTEKQKQSKASQSQGTVILLTDGENNLGISPYYAIEETIKKRIKVFTIGIGEERGAYVRGGIFTHLDEPLLQAIADQTGGDYYRASSPEELKNIYLKIGEKSISYEEKTLSLMPLFLMLSSILTLSGFLWVTHSRRF